MENCRDSVKNVGQSSEFATGEYNVFSLNDFTSGFWYYVKNMFYMIWYYFGISQLFCLFRKKIKQQTNREQQAALLNSPEDGDRMRLFDDRKEYTISGEHCF